MAWEVSFQGYVEGLHMGKRLTLAKEEMDIFKINDDDDYYYQPDIVTHPTKCNTNSKVHA